MASSFPASLQCDGIDGVVDVASALRGTGRCWPLQSNSFKPRYSCANPQARALNCAEVHTMQHLGANSATRGVVSKLPIVVAFLLNAFVCAFAFAVGRTLKLLIW